MNKIKIAAKSDTVYDFELTASNVDLKSCKAVLKIDTKLGYDCAVPCKCVSGIKWSVTLPGNMLQSGEYKYVLCVMVDQMYFEPVSGTIQAVDDDSFEIDGSNDKKTQVKESVDSPMVENDETETSTKPTLQSRADFEQQLKTITESNGDAPSFVTSINDILEGEETELDKSTRERNIKNFRARQILHQHKKSK